MIASRCTAGTGDVSLVATFQVRASLLGPPPDVASSWGNRRHLMKPTAPCRQPSTARDTSRCPSKRAQELLVEIHHSVVFLTKYGRSYRRSSRAVGAVGGDGCRASEDVPLGSWLLQRPCNVRRGFEDRRDVVRGIAVLRGVLWYPRRGAETVPSVPFQPIRSKGFAPQPRPRRDHPCWAKIAHKWGTVWAV